MKGQEKSLSSSESSDSGICLPNKKENINAADHSRSKPWSDPNQDRERVKRKVVTITHRPPKAISVAQRPQKAIRVASQTTPLKKQTTPAKTIPHPQKALPKTPTKTQTTPPQALPHQVFVRIFQKENSVENLDELSDQNDHSPVESKELTEGFNPARFSPPTLYDSKTGVQTILEGLQSTDDCLSNQTR